LDSDTKLAEAFEELTPGRQRGYVLHFLEAKQSETRTRRIEKCRPKIMAGKGYSER
ncbi:MAG: YdeI/OmpD-associated family protein, partial [Tabrizicola sp.]|nr:YdeI/OmpD-associated family protein [Tabrizicola sp.]